MADTKELTENEKRALEEYATSPGWYEYPGVDKALRKHELLDLLDGDEFTDEAEPDDTADEPADEQPFKVSPVPKPAKFSSITDTKGLETATAEVPVLELGHKHHGVKILKVLLGLQAYPCGTGPQFDHECERAVMEAQADHRIPVTGIVDARTWAALLDPHWS